jgi:polyisoprenyl-phosphate glycosyltransferase
MSATRSSIEAGYPRAASPSGCSVSTVDAGVVPSLSIVVPVHNEEDVLPLLLERLHGVLDTIGESWEILIVDDGSSDGTFEIALAAHANEPRIKLVGLSRNFGHQIALSAGLDLARGSAVVTMDADLQHPPEVIAEFVQRWRQGYDVVYGVMAERQGESAFKVLTARMFYKLLGRLSDTSTPPAAGDFRLVNRAALEAFKAMRESNRYLRGMFGWIGFRQVGVPYVSPPRVAGRSKYTPARMLALATNAIVAFSDRPLRIALGLGFGVSAVSLVVGLSALVTRLAGGFSVPGWATLTSLIGLVSGVQLIVLGVIGEYIARIYDEVKQRPLYVVRASHGLSDQRDGT